MKKYHRAVFAALALLAMFALLGATYAGFPTVRVVINGQEVRTDVPPVIVDGRTLVPIRVVSESLGATVGWDQATQTVTITAPTNSGEGYEDRARKLIVRLIDITTKVRGTGWNLESQTAISNLWEDAASLNPPPDAHGHAGNLLAALSFYYTASTLTVRALNTSDATAAVALASAAQDMISAGNQLLGEVLRRPGINLPPVQIPSPAPSISAPPASAPPATVPIPSGGVYSGVGSGHWVSKKLDGGKYIELEDRSLWEISSLDRINTNLWLPADNITVSEGKNPSYPYLLINRSQGQTAEAKLISR